MTDRLVPARELGRTGVTVPLIGYGTAPLGAKEISSQDASRCLNHAIDRGVTYLDTSPDYGSEPKVGEVMRQRRDEVFLATKVNRRSKLGVLAELRESLGRLRTDHVDLIQVHAVNAWSDLEQTFAPDGCLAALEEARREGMTRFIGITGHARPEILAEALRRYRFDTVLVALGMADRLVTRPERFLLPLAVERGVGVIAMKVFGSGALKDRDLALRYSLGLPGVSLAILGMKSVQEIDQNVGLVVPFHALDEAELKRLIDLVRPIVQTDAEEAETGHSRLFWLHDTSVTGWVHNDEPAVVAY
jgi:aryl-alcohol dehydrogenase-like predicted oxidoreductase